MFKTLHVRDFGIIEDVVVDLAPGLVVLTGETGAGKSLIVDAIALLLGQRADVGVVRRGARRAVVEAVVDISALPEVARDLEEAGYEPEEGEVRLTRVIQADGGSRAFVQGRIATAKDLREVGGRLVTIAGQHAFTRLSQSGERLRMLDSFAGLDADRLQYAERFRRWRETRVRLEELLRRAAESAARQDYLEYVIRQVTAVSPREGEVEALIAEREVLRQTERLKALASAVMQALYEGDGSAFDSLGRASQDLEEMARVDGTLADLVRRVEAARIEAREVARDAEAYIGRLFEDPARLQAVEDRIEAIRSLERRYGGDTAAVLATVDAARRELLAIDRDREEEGRLRAETEALEQEVREWAAVLSRKRRAASEAMSRAVTATLRKLGMGEAVLAVNVQHRDLTATGADSVDFLIETNPGEGFGRVEERASGGELSRITLALYATLSSSVGTPVLIADEMDAGVSGAVADRIGEVLSGAAASRQVIVVTHHGPIAARADQHLWVGKRSIGNRTVAEVTELTGEERLREIARMIGGREVTARSLEHAREMLTQNAPLANNPRKTGGASPRPAPTGR